MAEKMIRSRINWDCIETEEDDDGGQDSSPDVEYIPFYSLKVS